VEEAKGDNAYQVTGVAWSSNGASIAVAYGKSDHVSWCEHNSVLHVWSIFRREFSPTKPNITIEVPNCLSCIAFHPSNPLILAGGTINGEILIWNIDNTDEKGEGSNLICKSEADEYFHREPIQKIQWVEQESVHSMSKQMSLVTVSKDGKILIWDNPLKSLRYPIKGHIFGRKKDGKLIVLSGLSLSMVTDTMGLNESSFIVGTEGGMILKVVVQNPQEKDIRDYLSTNKEVTWSDEAMRFLANI